MSIIVFIVIELLYFVTCKTCCYSNSK